MTSSAAVDDRPTSTAPAAGAGEAEPLLVRPRGTGDEPPHEDKPLCYNWLTGTAPLAQVGGFLLVILVWASVFTHKLITFSIHPLLNSLGILLALEAVLILQPTGLYNPTAKRRAAYTHAVLVAWAAVCFYTGLAIVIYHKGHAGIPHFETAHSIFGIITYVLLLIQALVGFTQLFVPQVYGSEGNAKKMYKYHRFFGYAVILPLLLVTIVLATKTPYAEYVLKIKTWAMVLCVIAIVAGVYPRIKMSKIKWTNGPREREEGRT